jgi:hypothetical protein
MEDPEMFSRPWTATIPLTNDHESRGMAPGPIFEYACHEGNYAMEGILGGARQEEQAQPSP